jgi:hypothetical protein
MLIGVGGDIGSGKTLTATYIGAKYALQGKTVYANYTLRGIPYVRVWAIRHMNQMHNGVFLADELWTWLDCRRSQQEMSKGSSILLAKSRKKGFDVVWTAQLTSSLDKRPRRMTQKFLFPEMLPSAENPRICRVQMVDRTMRPMGTFMYKAAGVFKLYDTEEEVMLPAEFYEDIIRRATKKRYLLSRSEYFAITEGRTEIEDMISELSD